MKIRQRCLYIFLFTIFNHSLRAEQDHNTADDQEFFALQDEYDEYVEEIYPLIDMDQIVIIEDTIEQPDIEQPDDDAVVLEYNDSKNSSDVCMTIPVNDTCITMVCCDGLILEANSIEDNNTVCDDDDDIIPVPHELINSVKKANKQKKKLEKLEKNKRKKSLKKSKYTYNE